MRLVKFVDLFFSGYSGFGGATDYENEEFERLRVVSDSPFDSWEPTDEPFTDGISEILNSSADSWQVTPERKGKKNSDIEYE